MQKQKLAKTKKIQKPQKPKQPQKAVQKTTKQKNNAQPVKKTKVVTIQDLVKRNKNFTFTETGKVKCKLTGHQMPPTVDQFQNYLNSKSYKRGLQTQYDISQYQEIIIQHKKDPKYLYCQLTGVKIPKKKSAVEKHINGKKFQRRLQQYKQDLENQQGEQDQQINGQQFEDEQEQQENQQDNQN